MLHVSDVVGIVTGELNLLHEPAAMNCGHGVTGFVVGMADVAGGGHGVTPSSPGSIATP
ncbi:Uncharacterised protein [Mycobacteroides abscessus subsp. abscessus]|nr:Uncharacterised protein [Mycobacteroides abscessus subsp. abscessus]SIB17471.1 Uncharacterised protein [Mycobacteroides abscessus subsp. abscessus]SLJ67786.1 Uncharacterised protein [Mycobacteroides abscessus subsp. abscessus]